MKQQVIVVTGTRERENELMKMVNTVRTTTSIKAWPNVDYGAVFFPVDIHDQEFICSVLRNKGFEFVVEDAQ